MLFQLDFTVPDFLEEGMLGLAERLGVQVFASPCIEEAPGGEENFRFTGKTVVSFLASSIEQNPAQISEFVQEFLKAENAEYSLSRREYSDNEDWMKIFRSYFSKIRIGKNIFIQPPWEPLDNGRKQARKDLTIVIDPGMAFGTGTHETTRLCLKFISEIDVRGGYFLDIGAGSGILSIFLLKKGAAKLSAVEIDGPAVENLRKNYDLNGKPGSLDVFCKDLRHFEPENPADGLVANITSPILLENFHRFYDWLKPGGWAVFSGINSANAPDIKKALRRHPFDSIRQKHEGEWFAFMAKKT